MASIANQERIAEIRRSVEASEPGECIQFARARFLDELPGAVFVAITLLWVVSAFAGFIW